MLCNFLSTQSGVQQLNVGAGKERLINFFEGLGGVIN